MEKVRSFLNQVGALFTSEVLKPIGVVVILVGVICNILGIGGMLYDHPPTKWAGQVPVQVNSAGTSAEQLEWAKKEYAQHCKKFPSEC